MSRLSDLAARFEEWTRTKSGQWPTRSMDDDFNEAAAALREAEQVLLDGPKERYSGQRAEAADFHAYIYKNHLRYMWLKERRFCADFEYGDKRECVIVIHWPSTVGVSGNFDLDLDEAMKAKP